MLLKAHCVDGLNVIMLSDDEGRKTQFNIIKIKQIFGPVIIDEVYVCVLKANGSYEPFFLWAGAVGALNHSPVWCCQSLRWEVHPKANAQSCPEACRSHDRGSRSEC